MKRAVWLFIALSLMFGSLAGTSSAQELPVGVPDGALKATVTGFIDGDSIKVSLNRKGTVVELAGLDAPESDECFGEEAVQRLKSLIPKPTTVYLQESGVADGKEVTRFVWVPGKDGGKAYLLNTKLVREGFAGVNDAHVIDRYGNRIQDAELDAKEAGKGVWGRCESLHQFLPPPPSPTPEPTPIPTPIPTPTPEPEPTGFTQEEQAYAADVVDITAYLNDSFDVFSSLMGDASDDPYLMFDSDWAYQVGFTMGFWKFAYTEAQALVPPDSLAQVHALFLEALRLYDQAADTIAYGVDYLDTASLDFGGSLIIQGNEMMDLANDALETFLSSR